MTTVVGSLQTEQVDQEYGEKEEVEESERARDCWMWRYECVNVYIVYMYVCEFV